MREIITEWTAPGTAPGLSVMYFSELEPSVTIGDQRAALALFFGALASLRVTTSRWTIRTTGRELDPVTGTLTGEWTDSTAQTGVGTGGTNAGANATQLLVRWNTGTVDDGRFVKGRTNIPSISTTAFSNGEPLPAAVTTATTAAGAFLSTAVGFGVWRRPRKARAGDNPLPARAGAHYLADTASVWNEFAVLRNRRS